MPQHLTTYTATTNKNYAKTLAKQIGSDWKKEETTTMTICKLPTKTIQNIRLSKSEEE